MSHCVCDNNCHIKFLCKLEKGENKRMKPLKCILEKEATKDVDNDIYTHPTEYLILFVGGADNTIEYV